MGCIKHPESKDYTSGHVRADGITYRCAQCVKESRRRTYDKHGASARNSWTVTRAAALRRGIVFNLTAEEYAAIVALPCAYGDGTIKARIGIDRKNSAKGYTRDNCAPCCYRHNMMKSNILTHEQALDAAHKYLVMCGDAPKRNKLPRQSVPDRIEDRRNAAHEVSTL